MAWAAESSSGGINKSQIVESLEQQAYQGSHLLGHHFCGCAEQKYLMTWWEMTIGMTNERKANFHHGRERQQYTEHRRSQPQTTQIFIIRPHSSLQSLTFDKKRGKKG